MSATLWCEVNDPSMNIPNFIGHPFPASDPDAEHYSRTRKERVETGNSYGKPTYQDREVVTTEVDICGYHFRKQNPFQATQAVPTEETKTEDYLKGYREGVLHGEIVA